MKSINWKNLLISLLIIVITFGYFFDDFALNKKAGGTDFYSFEALFYYSKMKIFIILFCLIWFFTTSHWWKLSILVIVTIELLKFISIFDENQVQIDAIEYYTSLPITVPIVLLLFIISKKLNKYNFAKKIRLNIDEEINDLFFELYQDKKNKIIDLNKKFEEAKLKQHSEGNDEYFKRLISIRDKFYDV